MSLLKRLRNVLSERKRIVVSRPIPSQRRPILECLEDRTLLSGLVPGVPPSANFTLSNWYLTLPAGTNNHPDTVTTSQLVSGYSSPYFYTGSDGAMVFWVNVNGVTTKNSSYPRSELRETKSDGSLYNWNVNDGLATLDATLAINQVPSTGKVVIGQIHDVGSGGISDEPIIKLVYKFDTTTGTGSVVAEVRSLPTSDDNTNYTVATKVPLNAQFSYQIQLGVDRSLRVKINGATQFLQTVDASWLSQGLYFKAGSYIEDNAGPATEGGRVSFYQLTVTHTSTAPANSPPTVTVNLDSAAPRTNDIVTATAFPADIDNDPVSLTYVWMVNGDAVQTHVQNATTDSLDLSQLGQGNAGDVITVSVTPNDGTTSGIAFVTTGVTVANTAPTILGVSIIPLDPKTSQIVTANVSSHDDDGDTVGYAYQWYRNGIAISDASGSTLDLSVAGQGDKGDIITVSVTPNDGSADGQAMTSAGVTIANSCPIIDRVTITPDHPSFNQKLVAHVSSHDNDGDPVYYVYQWLRNGIDIDGANAATFELGDGDEGQLISVTVTPNDGSIDGLAVTSAGVTVQIVLPISNDVSISPLAPTTNQVLTASVTNYDGDTFA